MLQKLAYIILGIAGVGAIAFSVVVGPYALEVEHFDADSTSGHYADFYLYVSSGAVKAAEEGRVVTILVQPNNSGTNSDDPDVHRRDAWWTGFERKGIANELGVVLLVPAFVRPGEDWKIYTHALDRDVMTTQRKDLRRLDLQLIAMVEKTRAELAKRRINTDEKFLIQGFSASGMFANRFTALHPGRVKAVTAGSPGGWPIAPLGSWKNCDLPYPVGISDLASLTGTPFDSATYSKIPQLIYMGSQDDNDGLDFRDGWEDEPAALVDSLFGADPRSRWEVSRKLYERSGANAEFLLVDGVGHDRRELQKYSTGFLANVLDQQNAGTDR